MRQLLSFMLVLSLADKLVASCANNQGLVYLRFGFSWRQKKKKKLSIDMNPSSGSLDKLQSVRVHENMPCFECLYIMWIIIWHKTPGSWYVIYGFVLKS